MPERCHRDMPRSSPMWRYTLRDFAPDDDPETWARSLAEQGWRMWIPGNNGAELTIHGRKVRRYSLRRWEGEGGPPSDEWGSSGVE